MLSSPRGRTTRIWPSLLALAIGACGGESEPSVPTSISVDPSAIALAFIGATQQVDATVLDQDGDPIGDAAVSWSSNGEGVATVSPGGLVTATGQGTAQITASSGDLAATADVTVIPAVAVEIVAGNGQSASAGGNVPIAPAVRVLDAADGPVAGAQVRFEVTSGGGNVSGNVKVTGADGVAALDSWTLGPSGVNTLSATVDGPTLAGEPLTFVATTDASTGFNIKIRYLGAPSASQLLAFAQAEVRWEGIITGDLVDIPLNLPANPHPCGEGLPAISETVDDLLILADLQPIDGPGAVLGRAGPCLTRLADELPVLGVMVFDTDDLDDLESFDLLEEVVVHEMGHVMGIGTLWPDQGLLADPVAQGGLDPHFTGAQALAAFNAAGGTDYPDEKVPVETDGGPGTQDSHWRESVFDNELMTGFINVGANPLSAVTVASLADQGYTVNPGSADPYTLPLPGVRAGARGRIFVLQGDALRLPLRRVDQTGRLREASPR